MSPARTTVLALAVLSAECAYNPPPVAMRASAVDMQSLTGRWSGSYSGMGRRGTISFTLVSGEDHAHGEVFMIPERSREAYQVWPEPKGARAPDTEILTIQFVAAERGQVWGLLDPYRDPECDCRAVTRFEGRVLGDVIEGTFTTHTAATNGPRRGVWKVRRQREPRPGLAAARP